MLLLKLFLFVYLVNYTRGEWRIFGEKTLKLASLGVESMRARRGAGSRRANIRDQQGLACYEEDCTLFAVLLLAYKCPIA